MKDKVFITLKDNQQPNDTYCFTGDNVNDILYGKIPEKGRKSIEAVSSVNRLLKEHKIITIPKKDSFKNDTIIEIRNSNVYTYNWVGVISTPIPDKSNHSCRIEITSRFDAVKKQHFLLYLLSSVYGFNIFNIDINSEEESDYIIILIILYLNKLIEAYRDGLYKEYIRREYNDYNFKGVMDVNRHLKLNTPFIGKTAYTVREYTYDNEILCLMRQTIDYIVCEHTQVWEGYLSIEPIFNEIVEVIENATPSYRKNINYADTLKCRIEISHPMYQNYEDARKLALMILNESGKNIFDNSEELSFSLLIDMAWLWEEFVAEKLLKEYNYNHLLTDGSRGSLKWADEKHWYPDFIERKNEYNRRIIFDAKYKFWDYQKNEDIHQLLSYLFITGGNKCGVIYPFNAEDEEWESINLYAFNGFYGDTNPTMYKLPLYIPQNNNIDYSEYCKSMNNSIKNWKNNFQCF